MKLSPYIKQQMIVPLVTLILFFFVWELVILIGSISPLVLPSPRAVIKILIEQFSYLVINSGITALEAFFGFILGTIGGFVLSILFLFSPIVEQAIYPYAIALKAIPLVALAPIVTTWFGTGLFSKILLAAIISFFPVLVSTIDGLRNVEPEALELFQTWSATPWQIFINLRFFNALPVIFSGLKIASSFAIVGAVVAEFVGAEKGIGFVIKSSSYFLSTDLTFAGVLISASIGLVFFALISLLEKKVIFWQA